MSKKISKILSILVDILIIIVIFFAVCISYMSITAKQNDNIPTLFGKTAFAIQTDSMDPTIKPGDFILGDKYDGQELKGGEDGTIISFKAFTEDGKAFINTHRIYEIKGDLIYTKGDKEGAPVDPNPIVKGDIISVYSGFRMAGFGWFITSLSTQVGFFLAFVLPVLLFTIWEIYKLIKVIMHNQKVKLAEEMANDGPSEEEKQAIIAEYLKKQENDASKDEEK